MRDRALLLRPGVDESGKAICRSHVYRKLNSKLPYSVDDVVGEPCPWAAGAKLTETYVKRIVAGPGDKLSVKDGHPVVNGVEKKDAPHIRPCGNEPACNLPKVITIPPNHYFMMGRVRLADARTSWGRAQEGRTATPLGRPRTLPPREA